MLVLEDTTGCVNMEDVPWGIGAPERSKDSCGCGNVVGLIDLDIIGNLGNKATPKLVTSPTCPSEYFVLTIPIQ